MILAIWCGQSATPVCADSALEIVSPQNTPAVVSLLSSSDLTDLADATSLFAEFSNGTLKITLCEEAVDKGVLINIVEGQVKINGVDPVTGPCDASEITKIIVESGPQANHIALDWGSNIDRLAVIAGPLSHDTVEIKGKVEVTGTLEINAPVIQAAHLTRGPTGNILLKENSELQNSENKTSSLPTSTPENIVLPSETPDATPDKSSQIVELVALPIEPKQSLKTADNSSEEALKPASAKPQTSNRVSTLPILGEASRLPGAGSITATVENRTLTITADGDGPIALKNAGANLKINGADPDTGPVALSLLDKIAIRSGASSHEITLDLNAATEKLTVEVAVDGNDTLIVNGALSVRERLTIKAPTIKVQGALSGAHIELNSTQKTLITEGASLAAPCGEIIIIGAGGQVLLQPGSTVDVSANGITGAGRIEISAAQLGAVGKLLAQGGGTIELQGGKSGTVGDFCFAGGVLDVSASAPGQKGGTIHLLGQSIVVDESARLDASGDAGGGTILIGGDARGQGTVPNAAHTVVARGAKITADALTNGLGGRIIVWSDKETPFEGLISARGGAEGGDGGFVEVSGKEDLNFKGQVDVGAPKGKDGSVELDPLFVVVLPPGLSANITAIDDLDYLTFKSGAIGETTAVIGDFFCELFGIGGCNFKPDGDYLGNLDVRYGSLNTAIALLVKAVPKLAPLKFKAPFHFVQKGILEAFTGNISVQSILGIVMLHSIDDSSGILEALYRSGGSLNFSNQTAGEKVKFETILTTVVMGGIDVNGADFEIYAGAPFDLGFIKDLIVGFLPGGTFLEKAAGLENQNFLNDLNVSKILKTFIEGLLDPNQPSGAQQAVSFLNILCKDCIPVEISYAVDIFTNPAHNLGKFDDLLVALGADVPGWVSDMFDIIGDVTDYFADVLSPVGIINAALGGIEVFPDFHLFDIPGLCDLWDEIPCSLTDLVFDVIGPLIIEGIEKLVSAITGKDFDDISKFFESPIIIRDFSVENNSYPPLHVNDSINNPLGTITLRNDSLGSVSFGGPLTAREVTLNTPRGPIRNTRVTNALRTAGPGTGEIKANKITLDAAGGIGQIHGFGPNSNQLGFLGALTSGLSGASGFQFNDGGAIPYLVIKPLTGGSVDLKATNKGKGGIFLRSDAALTLSSAGFILNKNETVSGAFEPAGLQEIQIDTLGALNVQSTVTNERGGGSIRSLSTLTIAGEQNWAGDTTLEARPGSGSGHDLMVNANVFSTTLTLKAGDNVTVSVGKQANASTGAINVQSGANTTINGTIAGIGGSIQAGQNANLNATSTFQTGTGAGTITAGDNLTANGNISATDQNLNLNAGENITLNASSITNIGTGTLTILGDVGDNDTTGSTVTIDGTITAAQLNATGGNQEDNFVVTPQVSAPIFVDGSNPTVRRGDVLDLRAPAGLLITQGLDKTISVQGRATIRHINIETILNVPPTVIMGTDSNATINESGTYKSTASFIDWGADSWTVRIDFGDGTPIETVQLRGGADGNGPFPTINLSHVYGDNGTYTLTVEVTDNQDSGKGRATATVTVNNLKPKVYLVTSPAILFHGGNAFLGRRGDSQTHSATGGDPGSDDLKFDWSYQLLPDRQLAGSALFDSTVYFNDGTAPGTSFRDGLPSGPGNYPYFTAIEAATVTFNEP
ncbi:MAG TPA: PKD domain-containing protein, partial [Abditibacteriaceae bacterium]